MSSGSYPGGRRSKRIVTKERASLVTNIGGSQKMLPCLVVNKSQEGFRLRGNFKLKRGQLVEIVLHDEPFESVRCEVMWTGEAGSKQAGEAGLQTVRR